MRQSSVGTLILEQLRRRDNLSRKRRERLCVVIKLTKTEGGDVSADKTSARTTVCDDFLLKETSTEECDTEPVAKCDTEPVAKCDTEPVAKRVMTEAVVKLCRYCKEEPCDEWLPKDGKDKFCYDCFIEERKVPAKEGKGPCKSCGKKNAANWRGALIRFPGKRVCLTCYDSLMTAQRKNKELIEQLRMDDPTLN